MTPKQMAFVASKLEGMSNRAAVVAAGYSPVGAKQMGTYLMKLPSVREALRHSSFNFVSAERFAAATFRSSAESWQAVASSMPKDVYSCPIEFLTDAMNCQELSIAVRAEFARALLPYHHAKVARK